METKVRKFSVSMPEEAYQHYKEKAAAAHVSISQYLYRAGSIVDVEQVVMFPLNQPGVPPQK